MISFCEINLVWEFEVWGWNYLPSYEPLMQFTSEFLLYSVVHRELHL
jgi:hypothetical protein